MTALCGVAKCFFVEANEALLVRPLCVALGYLPATDVDFLRVSVADAASYVLASTSSELLCASDAGRTRSIRASSVRCERRGGEDEVLLASEPPAARHVTHRPGTFP